MLNSCIVNPKVGLLSSHSCDCSGALWTPWHQVSKVCTHHFVALFVVFFLCSTKFVYCKWRLNAAETWQQGYKSQLSPLSGWPQRSMDETTIRYTLAANFASGVGPCTGIVESFKHLLCVTAHPHLSCEHPWALARDNSGTKFGPARRCNIYLPGLIF